MIHVYDAIPQYLHDLANRAGSHPGQQSSPDKEEKTMCQPQELMSRLEMVIVLAELFEENKLDLPCEVISAMDFIGPALMNSARKQMNLTNMGMAKMLLAQRKKMFAAQGMAGPDAGPIEQLIEALGDILPMHAKKDAPKPEAKPASDLPADMPQELKDIVGALRGGKDGMEVHVFVVGKEDEAPKA